MLKKIKSLWVGLFLVVSLLVTGCSNKDKLIATLTNLETKYYEINDNMELIKSEIMRNKSQRLEFMINELV